MRNKRDFGNGGGSGEITDHAASPMGASDAIGIPSPESAGSGGISGLFKSKSKRRSPVRHSRRRCPSSFPAFGCNCVYSDVTPDYVHLSMLLCCFLQH